MVVSRDKASGSREAFAELLREEKKFLTRTIVQSCSGQLRSIASNTPEVIGYLSIGYIGKEAKIISLNGVKFSVGIIKNRNYQFMRTLYLLTCGKTEGINREFIDFVLTPKVQKEIVKKAYILFSKFSQVNQ